MALSGSLSSVLGIKPKMRASSSGGSTASTIKVGSVPKEKSHFDGLGPSNPIVMAPKQATADMQPTLGVYPGNQSVGSGQGSMRNTRAQGLPSGMPADLGMSSGPLMQPAVNPMMMGQNQIPSSGGLGPSMDPLMRRRMMAGRPAGF